MKIVFAGTPEFAASALAALLQTDHEIVAVYTQPDRKAGRGQKLTASAVKQLALQHGLPVHQPLHFKASTEDGLAAQAELKALNADVMVVAAYGLILPQWVLDLPARGCLNIHASLLPRWRGAAPIHRAIQAGDIETGVTIMQMDAGLDTGAMLLTEKLPIGPRDTTASLHDRLADMGGRLIVEALELAACGGLQPVPQPEQGVTYAHKIEKSESAVDWSLPAHVIGRQIRAFDPFPGASTTLGTETVKLWDYEINSYQRLSDKRCGQILSIDSTGVLVACGEDALRLTTLQRAGGKRLPASEFLRGFPLQPGMVLGEAQAPGTPGAPTAP